MPETSLHRAIGQRLRRDYDEVVQAPLPDDFVNLLRQIDEAAGKRASSAADSGAGGSPEKTL